ncbi:hypothetical protein [Verminephrobacter eiseniae]|uniref:hypothetical protein n=1 Tax=Verminephrobacter eiseniae TaxID=364317 RepID=UPI002237A631|nr:hypothetical protein [Verminephrobacter eiseniae]
MEKTRNDDQIGDSVAPAHPTVEERLRKVAEALRPIAKQLPDSTSGNDYAPVAVVSDVLTHMYKETAFYLEKLQDAICTRVNSDDPKKGCGK